MPSTQQTVQEYRSTLPPEEILTRAKTFFSTRPTLYATFLDREGPTFVSFRGQGSEEIVIAVSPLDGGQGTVVRGSTYLFDMQVSRFFTTLAPFRLEEEAPVDTPTAPVASSPTAPAPSGAKPA
jgi:hypothetical protein